MCHGGVGVGDVPVDEESSAVVEVARVGVHELQPVEPRLPRRQPEHAAQATLAVSVSVSPPSLSLAFSVSLMLFLSLSLALAPLLAVFLALACLRALKQVHWLSAPLV